MSVTTILMLIQLFFAVVIGLYFWNLLRNQKTNRTAVDRESRKEMERLRRMRSISADEAARGEDAAGVVERYRRPEGRACGR